MSRLEKIATFQSEEAARKHLYERYGGFGTLCVNKEDRSKTDLYVDVYRKKQSIYEDDWTEEQTIIYKAAVMLINLIASSRFFANTFPNDIINLSLKDMVSLLRKEQT